MNEVCQEGRQANTLYRRVTVEAATTPELFGPRSEQVQEKFRIVRFESSVSHTNRLASEDSLTYHLGPNTRNPNCRALY